MTSLKPCPQRALSYATALTCTFNKIEFSLKSVTNICVKKVILTCNLLGKRPRSYHGAMKTQVRKRIFKLIPIKVLVTYEILWYLRISFYLGKLQWMSRTQRTENTVISTSKMQQLYLLETWYPTWGIFFCDWIFQRIWLSLSHIWAIWENGNKIIFSTPRFSIRNAFFVTTRKHDELPL